MTSDAAELPGRLDKLQRNTLGYFLHETNRTNGMVRDTIRQGSHASITAIGLALACYAVGVERGCISREEAAERTLTTLRFFEGSEQSRAPDATGYRGFYYHFLDMETGRRARSSELSTIDTTFLIGGALAAGAYFGEETPQEREIRALAETLYHRVDWAWALNEGQAVSHGWKPERGFLRYRWTGYNEALLLYALGLGSPTHPLPEESYEAWLSTYRWKKLYGYEFIYGGPLFVHQLSHVWIDFRELQDAYVRGKGLDYFENSRRATYVQREYARRNPRGFKGYGRNAWGITASDGPGRMVRCVDGVRRRFYAYIARGVPYGPDDGTLSPWATVAALPFAPEIVLPALEHFNAVYPEMTNIYGFKCSFNPTFPAGESGDETWISQGYYGLDQGPIVLMIENYRNEFLWRLMMRCPYLVRGLRRAGFKGGWLEGAA